MQEKSEFRINTYSIFNVRFQYFVAEVTAAIIELIGFWAFLGLGVGVVA
ncbi:MAG: hypothetical protein LBE11_05530 [Prevotellaceae bacterium]|jgi:hypothetical protein|nr:hypothetical protein [Prevotellaceae bacterium]